MQAAQRGVDVETFKAVIDRENRRAAALGKVCFDFNQHDDDGATVLNTAAWKGN